MAIDLIHRTNSFEPPSVNGSVSISSTCNPSSAKNANDTDTHVRSGFMSTPIAATGQSSDGDSIARASHAPAGNATRRFAASSQIPKASRRKESSPKDSIIRNIASSSVCAGYDGLAIAHCSRSSIFALRSALNSMYNESLDSPDNALRRLFSNISELSIGRGGVPIMNIIGL